MPQQAVWHCPFNRGKGRLPLKAAALLMHLSWPRFLFHSSSFASDLDTPWQQGKFIQQADWSNNLFLVKKGAKPPYQ